MKKSDLIGRQILHSSLGLGTILGFKKAPEEEYVIISFDSLTIEKNWIFKGVLPLLLIAFLLFFFKGAYMVDGKIDWFWLWMCVGAPFGIVYLAVFVIPVNMDITSSLGVLFAHLVISGLFGGFIGVWTVVKAFYYLVLYPFIRLFNFAPN